MINVKSIEIHASYHCNLSCRNCMHMSPIECKRNLSTDELHDDLKCLHGVLYADEIRLLGGEPLLNEELPFLAKTASFSGVGKKVTIATNGVLLDKWKDNEELWRYVDVCEVSIYRQSMLDVNTFTAICISISKRYGVKFFLYFCNSFRKVGSFSSCNNLGLTNRIFNSCVISKCWQCFNVFEGRFYLCPQAVAFCRNIKELNVQNNSILLKNDSLEDSILNYISRKEPLPVCYYCYGCVGKKSIHEQIGRKKYLLDYKNAYTQDDIDSAFLNRLLQLGTDGLFSLETIDVTTIIENGIIKTGRSV